jgi:hypothetical protein
VRPVLWLILLALTASCARSAPAPAGEPVRPELWVDPGALEAGDGTRQAPFKTLPEALERAQGPAVIRLATGMFRGPFAPPDGTSIVGSGATVIFAGQDGAVFSPAGSLELSELVVQGGEVGIATSHELTLTHVELSSQRRTGVFQSSGTLRATGSRFSGSVAGAVGARAGEGARLELTGCSFTGDWRRGLQLDAGASAQVLDGRFEGPATAVHSIRGQLELVRVEISGGREAGIFGSGGSMKLTEVRVQGHEYGIVIRDGAEVSMTKVTSHRAERAGIALVGATARIDGLEIASAGSFGGIHLIGGELQLTDFVIRDTEAYGLNVNNAQLRAANGRITKITDFGGAAGDAVHLRRTRAVLTDLTVEDTAGSAVLAAEGSQVAVHRLSTQRNRWGAVLADTAAHVEVDSLEARDVSNVVSVPGEALVKLDKLTSERVENEVIWAECEKGARVLLGSAVTPPRHRLPCVGVWQSPSPFDPLGTPESVSGAAPTPSRGL